jgi:hypothetical protein
VISVHITDYAKNEKKPKKVPSSHRLSKKYFFDKELVILEPPTMEAAAELTWGDRGKKIQFLKSDEK